MVSIDKILCPHCSEDSLVPSDVENTAEEPNVAAAIVRMYESSLRQRQTYSLREYIIELIGGIIGVIVASWLLGGLGIWTFIIGFGIGFLFARLIRVYILREDIG